MVENIERNIALGLSPKEAAHKTMDEVGTAVIAIAVVLSAVFVPTAFIPGIQGAFYQQFALTIAVRRSCRRSTPSPCRPRSAPSC